MEDLEELRVWEVRSVYLITYSRADIERFTKENFAHIVKEKFEEAHVLQWACCRELHRDGGYHFHMCIKLNKIKRWLAIKQLIHEEHDIVVHFSSTHTDYYSAWNYVQKDWDFVQSEGHPDLLSAGVPRTTRALEVRRRRRGDGNSSERNKKSKLTNLIISDTILENNKKFK